MIINIMHTLYTLDEYLDRMSYLLQLCATPTKSEPITIESTLKRLNVLFNNSDDQCGHSTWNNSPQTFVSTFMHYYWSDDVYEEFTNVSQVLTLNFPARQYFALRYNNYVNRLKKGKIYDFNAVQFQNLDQLVELFTFLNDPNINNTESTVDMFGTDVFDQIPYKTTEEVHAEQKQLHLQQEQLRVQQEQEQEQLRLEKLTEAGITDTFTPISTYELSQRSQDIARQYTEICMRELSIRRNFYKQTTNLLQTHLPKMSEEPACSEYLTQLNALNDQMSEEITNTTKTAVQELNELLNKLKHDMTLSDTYNTISGEFYKKLFTL